jgi:hypothetical protein
MAAPMLLPSVACSSPVARKRRIAIYGLVALMAALMLVGIPLLVVGVIAWVVLASLAAAKASRGQAYRIR